MPSPPPWVLTNALGRLPVVELRVVGGPGAGRRVPLEPGEHRLGSHRYSRIVLPDHALARVHLVIEVDAAGGVSVAPAGGAACRVDGERLLGPAPAPVRPGQLVAAGGSLLAFGRPGEVPPPAPEVAPPPATPSRLEAPDVPLARSAVLALGGTAIGTALAAGVTAAAWGPHAALAPVGLAPVAGAGAVAWSQRGPLAARARFRERVVELDRAFAAARRARLAELTASAPDAAELLRALERGPARPRRHPGHPDWLRVRLGWADQPSGLAVIVPARGAPALRTEAVQVAVRHAALPGAPVALSLTAAGSLAVTGDPAAGLAFARWLAVQVAALHDDAVVAAALPAGAGDGFGWVPSLTLGPEAAGRLTHRLAGLVAERQSPEPAVVAILHSDVVGAVPPALVSGRLAGVHVVWLAAGEDRRRAAAAVLDLPAGSEPPTLALAGREPWRLGGADGLTAELAGRAAGWLGGLPALAPHRPDLAELLRAGGQPEHHVLATWIRDRASPPPRRLRAVLGVDLDGRPVELELRAACPHAVLAGPDATDVLRCLVLSLAVRHAPRTLELALIGPALDGLAHLPHVVPLPAGARPPGAPRLLVAVDGPPPVGLGGVDVHVVVAARDLAAAEASLGRGLTRRVAPGPAGASGLEAMASAVLAVGRMLGSLQSSR